DDHLSGSCCVCARNVDAEQRLALAVDRALRGVDVLRRLVVAHRTRAESEHATPCIPQRKHDAFAEAVIETAAPTSLDQTGLVQLAFAEARAECTRQHPVPGTGREPNAEPLEHVAAEPTFDEVVPSLPGFRRLPQVALAEHRGPPKRLVQP